MSTTALLLGWHTASMPNFFYLAAPRMILKCLNRLLGTAAMFVVVAAQSQAQSPAVAVSEQNAAALLEKHTQLVSQLANNVYGRPLYLESSETSNMVSGNAYAVLDAPFPTVSTTLKSPKRWCEVMILHLNTKYCSAATDASPAILNVNIGKKTEQELADAFALEFAFRLASASSSDLTVLLNADKGPLGTTNYRIELRAVPLPDGKTFMHLRYAYGYGMAGKLAMQGYLATLGSGKVGFTQVPQRQKTAFVGGMRGTVERNTMRYYLAIEAYLASLGRPVDQQVGARLEHWFNATEQYARQLHEIDKPAYLAMKKNEYQRQKTSPAR
ncbi:MAG: hypothetical protein V4614_11100 [Pseudomonadota bacterium]